MALEHPAGGKERDSNAVLDNEPAPRLGVDAALLWKVFDTSPNLTIVTDNFGTIVLSSGAIKELLGYEPAELVGQPLDILLMPEYRASHAAHFRQFLEAPGERPMAAGLELTARHHDGSPRAVDITLRHTELAGRLYAVAEIRNAVERRLLSRSASKPLRKYFPR